MLNKIENTSFQGHFKPQYDFFIRLLIIHTILKMNSVQSAPLKKRKSWL